MSGIFNSNTRFLTETRVTTQIYIVVTKSFCRELLGKIQVGSDSGVPFNELFTQMEAGTAPMSVQLLEVPGQCVSPCTFPRFPSQLQP